MPQTFSTLVDNALIKGIITHFDPYDLTVEITEPFSGFSSGCHIPYFARNHSNYTGKHGQEKASELLIGLYKDLLVINSKQPVIQGRLEVVLAEIQSIQAEQMTLRESKASHRRVFMNGDISQAGYQVNLKDIRARDSVLEAKKDSVKTAFFERNFSGCRGFISIDQLFKFLRKTAK